MGIDDANTLPMCYPLFFIYNNFGWFAKMQQKTKQKRVTIHTFMETFLAVRPGIFSPFLNGGRLFQQFVIDIWLQVEMNTINFLRFHMKDLKKVTKDIVRSRNVGGESEQAARTFILPKSFAGSPR